MSGCTQSAASARLAPEAPAANELGYDAIGVEWAAQGLSSNGNETSTAPLDLVSAAANHSNIDRERVHELKPMAPPPLRIVRKTSADESNTPKTIQQQPMSSVDAEGNRCFRLM